MRLGQQEGDKERLPSQPSDPHLRVLGSLCSGFYRPMGNTGSNRRGGALAICDRFVG